MKRIIVSICVFLSCVSLSAESYVTFSKWEVSSICVSERKGEVLYSVIYKDVEYFLSWDEYSDLMDGKDITKKTE